METVAHTYCFYVDTPEGKQGYCELKAKLSGMGLKVMESHGGNMHYQPELDNVTVTLETKHLFDNQWNADGKRLFDWAQDYQPNGSRTIKQGHWLEQTPEMREIRRNTCACGYCGKQEPAAKGYVFCPHCLDSAHLKASQLHLTRMLPVDRSGVGAKRAELSEAERAHLLPLYRTAQLHGTTERGKARVAKARADIERKFKAATENAKAEHDGMLWLMDNGISTENVIFYDHTGRFCFGWRQPVEDELLSDLLEVISEFSFPYDIKCADGRTLSGN